MDKRTVLAFALIGLILILTQTEFYKSRVMPRRTVVTDTLQVPGDTSKINERIENQRETGIDLFESKNKVSSDSLYEESSKKEYLGAISSPGEEKTLTILSPFYEAKISSKGGGLVSWRLMDFFSADSQKVQLIHRADIGQPVIGLFVDEDTITFDRQNYELEFSRGVTSNRVILDDRNRDVEITLRLNFNDGKQIEKRFRFYADRYDIDFSVTLKGFAGLTRDKSYQLMWNTGLLPTEMPISDDLGYTKIYAYLGEDMQDFNINEKELHWKYEERGGAVSWAAIRTKYFVVAVAPMEEKGRSILYRGKGIPLSPQQRFKWYNFTINMPMADNPIQENEFRLYLGPLEYNKLKSLPFNLAKLIMGSSGYERLFRPFSILILRLLKFMHNFIANYGIVIIIFSILIKLVLFPLTHKSYVSMKKMQLIQPKMTELREKYKKDPQQLNKRMMELYKEYGVNPMGGCLPMLLQMPLLIGLFIVFRSTIELRGADFMLWINDLSKPDSIFTLPFALPLYGRNVGLLPIVMGLTMFFQQKSTMQDPRQKAMAYFMPIFFVFLFNSFPSGLNLYYTLFNVWTIVQQKFIKMDDLQLKPVEKKTGKRKRAGRI